MGKKYFVCKTNNHPVEYKTGEKMVFDLELREDGKKITCHTFSYTIERDFEAKTEGTASGESGLITLETVMNKPGFARVICRALDENGEKLENCDDFEGGAGAEVETLRTTTPMPEDFTEFWENCRKELYSTDVETIGYKEIVKEEYPDFYIYDMKIKAPGNMPVSGYLTAPKKEGKFPAYVCYKGYGVVPAPISCQEDKIIFYINAHGIENGRPDEYYQKLAKTRLKDYGLIAEKNEDPEKCYFKYMALRAAQAARFVQTLDNFNGELILHGGSQGAFQATSASTLVPETKLLDIYIPWLCDINAASIGRIRYGDPQFVRGIAYYDLTNLATRITAPVKLMAGLGDYTCHPTGIFSFYNAIPTHKEMRVIQNKIHLYQSPEAEEFKVNFPVYED
jgi:cephalosporin-C deacetylase-like acetyl esterase